MKLRLRVVGAALAVGVVSATSANPAFAADPSFAAVPSAGSGSSPLDASGRAVVVTGRLTSASPGGSAVLLIDVGRRHPQEKPLSVVTTAATVVTKAGRAARLTSLKGTKVTVTGKRAGDRVTASKIAA